ncbi:restriction endonuclease subunit S [Priestia megaterium]|uniref:restriction endonuclease subunit S n=1 Tax=Priestia megaterium TaxID=1404 RepID=UPI00300BE2DF
MTTTETVIAEIKETELGDIPVEWNVMSIEEISKKEKNSIKIGPFGSQLKKEFLVSNGYKVYGQENVFAKDFSIGNRYITTEKYNQLKSCELEPHDFVISMMGTIGKCAIVPDGIKHGIMDSHLIRIRLDENVFQNKLLLHVISSDLVQRQIKRLSVGGIMAGLSSKVIRQIKLPVPSLDEQQKITEILSTVDEQIKNASELVVIAKELKRGLIQQLFKKGIGNTNFKQTVIGEIPTHWETSMLGDIVYKITDGAHKTPKYTDKGIPFLRVVDIQKSSIDWDKTKYISIQEHTELIKRCHPEKGDILISKNGTIGITKLINWEEEFSIFVSLCLIKLHKENSLILPEFLVYFFESMTCQKQFKNSSKQGTVTNLHLVEIRKLIIPLPTIEEQQKIAKILSSVDEQIESYEQEKEKYMELKKGLMQQLLTGKLRVTV